MVKLAIEKPLLVHWWHYYGKGIYTFEELEKFDKIIDKYGAERVFDVAIASYICGDGSPTIMLKSIRNNCVKELFESLPSTSNMNETELEQYTAVRNSLVEQFTQTMTA